MEEITIPYHLATPTIICLIVLGVILFFRRKIFSKNKLSWFSVSVFFVLYLFIVAQATYDDIYYQWDLNRYDINKDGMFNGAEVCNEQKEAMRKLISDTGRNFSFITGIIYAFFISTVIYISGRIISKLKVRERSN